MRAFAVICAGLLGAFGLLVLAIWFLPENVVESWYPTLEAARKDHLFGRGWLPDILPPSSVRISVSNNLDLNTSWGSFHLHPKEWSLFVRSLTAGSLSAPFVDWEGTVATYRKSGFHAWHFATADARWVFFCKPEVGRCEYVMWLKREG